MKKYYIFIAIAIASTLLVIGIPQLRGTAFVERDNHRQGKDWLSGMILKLYKEPKNAFYHIPPNIRAIKFSDGSVSSNLSSLSINRDTDQLVMYNEGAIVNFSTIGDTLHILKNANRSILTISIDTNINHLIFDNVNKMETSVHQTFPLAFTVENNSNVTITGNKNLHLHKMTVKGRSTLNLNTCFTNVVDMQIDNSMVYMDPLNNIDSVSANLIGKSNIKMKNTLSPWQSPDNFEKIKKELSISETNVNIYATGDTQYYDRTKSTTEISDDE